jgi:hypothetical protein
LEKAVEEKLTQIEQQLQQLQIFKQELNGLLSGWESVSKRPEETICPIIEQG